MEEETKELPKLGILKALQKISKELKPIGKNQVNTSQNYKFRGIDDIYNALQPLFSKHGVITVPRVLDRRYEEHLTRNKTVMQYRILTMQYRFYSVEDGSFIEIVMDGEGSDMGDKATSKAKAMAHKYTLFQLFNIPTESERDPDSEAHIRGQKQNTNPNPNGAPPANQKQTITPPQLKRLFAIGKTHGWNATNIDDFVKNTMKLKSKNDLTKNVYDKFIVFIEGGGKPTEAAQQTTQ